jgi:Phage integrase, N-terminal SAM-like domain
VVSDIFGVSGRVMMAALIAGERDPHVLAQMARARMRTKIARLEEAFNGHFDDHHRFLLARMLDRIDSTEADIAALDNQIEAHLVPFAAAAARLDEIPGIGPLPPRSSSPRSGWTCPRAGRITLATVYQSWLASRLDLSPKVRRGYEDIWRLRIEPRFGGRSVGKIDRESIQKWVNEMAESGLSPRTLQSNHSVLKMCLDHAADKGQLLGRNPAARTKFPPVRPTAHTCLTTAEVAALTLVCGRQADVVSRLAYTGMRFGELPASTSRMSTSKRAASACADLSPRSAASSSRATPSRQQVGARFLSPNASSPSSRPGSPGAGRASGDHLPPRARELEAVGQVAPSHHRDRPPDVTSARSSPHLRVIGATGSRRSAAAAEDHGPRLDHRDRAHSQICTTNSTMWLRLWTPSMTGRSTSAEGFGLFWPLRTRPELRADCLRASK